MPPGEGSADALCDRFLPDVLRWCTRLGGPYVDAEDAAHEVMLTVIQRSHTVRQPEQLPAWVFGVTRRTLAWHRRKSIWKRFVATGKFEPADPARGPDGQAGALQEQRAVRAVLETMPAGLREVLVLCDLEERSDLLVSGLLGIPEGTVKSRLRRARSVFAAAAVRAGLHEGGNP